MRTYLRLAFCAALAACGSVKDNSVDAMGGGDDTGGGDFTLSVAPGSIDIPIASSGMVTVAIDRTGTVGDVTLSAQGLPAGITASFDPNPVSANSAIVTFAVAGGTPAGASTVTIVGTVGGVQKTAPVIINAKTINVAGTVIGGAQGVTVRIVGKAATTSGTGGTFSFTDVTPPYDLYVIGTAGSVFTTTYPAVNYYKGLTRPDPSVTQPLAGGLIIFMQTSSGTISGTKSGGDGATTLRLIWDSGGQTTASPPSSYSFSASWPQATTHAGVLYGFQYTTSTTGAPNAWPGFGNANATLTANTTTNVPLTLTAPSTAQLTGQITAPSGFPAPSITLTQKLGATAYLLWSSSPTTTADATIPVLAAGKSTLSAYASVGGATTQVFDSGLNAAKDVTFALLAPPVQNTPLASAVGVTATTPFTWSSTPMTVYAVAFTATTTTGTAKVDYQLFTSDAMATIPNVPEVALPTNQSFSWSVAGYGPNASVNDAASAKGLRSANAYDFDGGRYYVTYSTSRSFTTGS